jgi:hypothetical protein
MISLDNSHYPRKQFNFTPAVARSFIADMRALFAVKEGIKRDEIVARQAWLLSEHLGPREKKLRLIDVREMFVQMRAQE